MKILIVIAIAAGSVLLVRILEIVIRTIIGNRVKLKFIHRLLPVFELLIGLALIFWAVNFLFFDKPYYFILTIILVSMSVMLISWYVFRDVLAGIVFRTQNSLPRGAAIQLGDIRGRMLGLRSMHIIIETEEGKTIRIPYSRISGEIISEQLETGLHEDSTLILNLPKNKSWAQTEVIIKNTLMNSPWRLLKSEPVIQLLSEDNNSYRAEIHVKTHSKSHEARLYQILSDKFGTKD